MTFSITAPGNGRCTRCGKPTTYVGDYPEGTAEKPWCTCVQWVTLPNVPVVPAGIPSVWPAPWECPRCHAINAPHVTQCSCRPKEAA